MRTRTASWAVLWASLVVLVLAAVASGTGRSLITGRDVKDHSLGSADLIDHTIQSHDLSGKLISSLRGKTGATGPQGGAGPAGPAGQQGQEGPAGPQGATGQQGPEGLQGLQGPQGQKGERGATGAGLAIKGAAETAAGLPATASVGDAWIVGHDLYVWTGEAWTNTGVIQGPKGDKGDTGDTGPAGPQGQVGPAGPAGTAAVSVHSKAFSIIGAAGQLETVGCSTGQKAINGGFKTDGDVLSEDTFPTAAGDGWSIYLVNYGEADATGTVYAICLG